MKDRYILAVIIVALLINFYQDMKFRIIYQERQKISQPHQVSKSEEPEKSKVDTVAKNTDGVRDYIIHNSKDPALRDDARDTFPDFKEQQDLALKGNTSGMVFLGASYMIGNYVKQDKEAGYYWYKKAAELGDPQAAFQISLILEEKNDDKYKTYLQIAIESQYPPALDHIATLLFNQMKNGSVDKKTLDTAISFATTAIEKNYIRSYIIKTMLLALETKPNDAALYVNYLESLPDDYLEKYGIASEELPSLKDFVLFKQFNNDVILYDDYINEHYADFAKKVKNESKQN